MKFSDLATGSAVFVDANVFVYAMAPDPKFGPPCVQLLERIEQRDLRGFCSTHVLSDVAHRLMSLEACATFGWPYTGIAQRLNRHPNEVQKLVLFRTAIEAIVAIGVLPILVLAQHIISAASVSQQYGLLSNDALIVALMQDHGLSQIASHDHDFDRVANIQRFEPN